ncbi:choice-of-anchor D domain-containing protein, partial [candidate division KSB1 bacterium]|nr:choice-of-anchor D domain-containing protein [candidate division KSB1 bacterium]
MKTYIIILLILLAVTGAYGQEDFRTFSKLNEQDLMNVEIGDISIEIGLESGYDTLRNEYSAPYYVFKEEYQTYYEASKLVPLHPCKLNQIAVAFKNYDQASSKSKDVDFYVWKDKNGLPGDILVSELVTINLAAEESKWVFIEVSDSGIYLDQPFWVGHRELTRGAPSSLADKSPTDPKVNYYSSNGENWIEDIYDYLHLAVIDYQDIGDPEIDVKPDTLMFQVGLPSRTNYDNLSIDSDLYSKFRFPDADQIDRVQTLWLGDEVDEDYDTLSCVFEQADKYPATNNENPVIYEATRLFSPKPYMLKQVAVQFWNSESNPATKDVKFYVWSDENGRPGSEMAVIERTIDYPSRYRAWYAVDVSDFNIELNGYFWIGHIELSPGVPTSVGDPLFTPGVNFFSTTGSYWEEVEVDFLQMALVQSVQGFEDKSAIMISNKGTGDLFVSDIYADESWVSDIDSTRFFVPAGESKFIGLNANSEALGPGRYETTLHILSDDDDEPDYQEPVVLQIYGGELAEPDISVAPDTLNFTVTLDNATGSTTMIPDQEDTKILYISNNGQGELFVNYQIANVDWIQSITPQTFLLGPSQTKQVALQADAAGLAVGIYAGTLYILSNDPDEPVFEQPLKLNVRELVNHPHIVVSPDTLKFEARIGEAVTTDQESFLVSNGGEAVLGVSNISGTQTWVQQISVKSFSLNPQANRQVSVTVGIGSLTAGTYQGTIRINSNDPDTPIYSLPLVFNVLAAYPKYPDIAVTPDTLKFEARIGESITTDQESFLVSNGGEAVLNVSNISGTQTWVQ